MAFSTDAEAVAHTVTNKAVTPSNLDDVFAAPPALGGTTPAAVSGTNFVVSGNSVKSATATIKLYLAK